MKKGIIYINQFFAGIGGENMADFEPEIREGVIGSGLALKSQLKDVEITHTIICGDNFMGSKTDEAIERIMKMLEGKEFDFFFAGPAFQAGRYGVACGTIAKVIKEKYNIPVFSSMHIENPGVEMFKKDVIIFNGGGSAASMRANSKVMADYVNKICSGEKLGTAKEEQYFGRSIRHQTGQIEEREVASKRVVSMLLKKLAGEQFETELPIPKMERVEIAAPIKDLSKAKVALVTTGGIVPVANPDRIQSASATRWGMYDISGIERLEKGVYKTIHAGYDPAAADNDPNVCVPLDALRAYEKEGKIGAIDTHFYTTVGTGTTEAEATRMAEEIVVHLRDHNVDGIIMTSTWGTCTRCGATMVKVIEKAGFPVVIMANLIPVAKSVGANKIVPTISIPYPLGNPQTSLDEQWKLRYHRVGVALDSLTQEIKEQTVFSVKI